MKNLLLIVIVFFNVQSSATTITIFSDGNGQCRYVLSDDNAKSLATWTGDLLEKLSNAKRVDVAEGTILWKELRKLDPSLNLKNIQVINTKNESVIAKLKALSIPVIEMNKLEMKTSFRVNNNSDENIDKQQAQDYNSSRSNKANSIATVNNSNTSDDNKINSIATAQDYNSSRSNKANSTATAQDYNSSRSNKANSIAPAQDYNSSRSNKAGVILSAGMAMPIKNNYMKTGFLFNAGYHIPLKKSVGIEVGIGFWSNKFTYTPSSFFSKEYKNAIEQNIENNNWNNISISVGPSVMIGKGKYNATIYTKAAVLFTKIPQQTIGDDNPVALFGGNQTSFALSPGLRLNYSMNSKLSLFLNLEFLTCLHKNIPFKEKDISRATNADGKFNTDTFSSLPMEKKYEGMNLFGISAGLKINL